MRSYGLVTLRLGPGVALAFGDDASDADSGSVQTPTTVQQPTVSSQPATASSEPKSPLTMFVSQVDNSAYPQVTLYTKIADQAGSTPSGLDAF